MAERKQLLSKRQQLIARREQLLAERGQLLARQESLTATVRELRRYTNSAGFRIVEGVIRRLRYFPVVFTTTRAIARRIVRRNATAD